jgi:hypothetical protein
LFSTRQYGLKAKKQLFGKGSAFKEKKDKKNSDPTENMVPTGLLSSVDSKATRKKEEIKLY